MDIKNNAFATKDRTSIFAGKPDFKLTAAIGKKILEWCNEGKSLDIVGRINECKSLDELLKLFYSNPTDDKQVLDLYSKRRKEFEKQLTSDSLTTQKTNQNGTYSSKTK